MADQCIVCLEDLDVAGSIHDDLLDSGEVAASTAMRPRANPSKVDDEQLIALIKPCSHVLHDQCLREWSQKANSCPICRQAFNLVEVWDKVGGKPPSRPGSIYFSATSLLLILFLALPVQSWGV